MEDDFGKLLGSPRLVARVSSWSEAHRVLSKSSPATVVVDAPLTETSQANEIVGLNDVLGKDGKKAYLLSPQAYGALSTWTDMFDAIGAIIPPPQSQRQWKELKRLLVPHMEAAEKEDQANAQATARASDGASKKPLELVLRLPKITTGQLAQLPLSRVIYSLYARNETGVLQLHSGSMKRRFAFHDGRFVEAPDHHNSEALTSAYAWPDGAFEFQSRHSLSGAPQPIYDLMIEGLSTHRSQRQVMSGLMSRMKTYPVATQFWDQRCETIDWPVLERFLALCNGDNTLETIFSQMGQQVTDAFRSAVFSRDTDLVVFRTDPTPEKIHVEYDHRTTATTSKNQAVQLTKAERATGNQRQDLQDELQSFNDSLKSMSAHDIFGVWEGCGREVVKETYYAMVKEHHPDVYGGNVSDEIRILAQRIFIKIRNAYTELLKSEGEQTAPPPGQSDTSEAHEQPRRSVATLRPGEISASAIQSEQSPDARSTNPFGATKSSPIAMKRTPTSTHPDLEQQQRAKQRADKKAKQRTKKKPAHKTPPPKKTAPSSGNAKSQRPRRRDSTVGANSTGVGNGATNPEMRQKKLDRLKRRKTTPGRKPTPISSSKPKRKSTSSGGANEAFNVGYKKFKKHRYEEAFPYLKKAHEADPENGLYLTFFAYCLFQTNPSEVKRSRKLLGKAIDSEHRQSLPDAHLFLGHILKAQNKEKSAYKHFKTALELNPTSRDAEREIRLYERRHSDKKKTKKSKDSKAGGFFKKLFKE